MCKHRDLTIADLKTRSDINVGDTIIGYYLISRSEVKKANNGTSYHRWILKDSTDSIYLRTAWKYDEELLQFSKGKVVQIQAVVEEYQGRNLILIDELKNNKTTFKIRIPKPEEYSIEELTPSVDTSNGAILIEIAKIIMELKNPHIKSLVEKIYSVENQKLMSKLPASKAFHHSKAGEFLSHVLETVNIAKNLCEQFNVEGDRKDLVIAGSMLCQVGKLKAFLETYPIDYTTEYRLLGSIALTYEMVFEEITKLSEFPSDLSLHIKHIVVSYPGEVKKGALVKPATLEGKIVSIAYNASCECNSIRSIIEEDRSDGDFTSFNNLHNQFFYKK